MKSTEKLSSSADSESHKEPSPRKNIHLCVDIDGCLDTLTAQGRIHYDCADHRLPKMYVNYMLKKMKETIFSGYLEEDKLKNVNITLRLFSNRKDADTDLSNTKKNKCNQQLAPDILKKFSAHIEKWIDPELSSVSIYSDYHSKQISDNYFSLTAGHGQLFNQNKIDGPGKDKVDLAMAILAPLAGKKEVEVILIDDRFNPTCGDSPLTKGFCPFFKKTKT